MLINIGVIGMQYMYDFGMLTGRQNASAAFLQYKKADLYFFPAFCNAKRRTFFLRWLFASKIGRKSVWSTFSHAQKVKPCFFLPFCIENTLSQKKDGCPLFKTEGQGRVRQHHRHTS